MAISSKEWLCVLLNENGASFYLDANGKVKISLAPKPLANMFDGWMDIALNYGRSSKYLGLERTYSSNYKFVKDGATILRNLLYTQRSIESKVYLGLLKYNPDNGTYEVYYKAEIDLVECEDDPATGITVHIMQDGPSKYIKANESITYEIPCEGITVNNDGIRYTDRANYEVPDVNLQAERYAVPFAYLNSEGLSTGIALSNQDFEEYDNAAIYVVSSGNTFFKTYNQSTSVRVRGTLRISNLESAATSTVMMLIRTNENAVYNLLTPLTTIGPLGSYEAQVDVTISMTPNMGLFLLFEQYFENNVTSFDGTNLYLTFDTRFQQTQCIAKRPIDVFKELVSSLSDGRFTGVSSLLEANSHLVVAPADSIRGLASPKIKTTFSDFYESYGKILGGAIGVNYDTQEVLFETREYFMDNNIEIIDLGEVADFTIAVDKETIYNSIKVGYTSRSNEEAVAKEEVNASQTYSTPITRVKSELNLMIPYRTDIFGIEELRQKYFDLPNKDSQADSSIFILNINRTAEADGTYNLYRPAYSYITGGTNQDTWYNLEQLTPKEVLKTNANLYTGSLFALGSELIKFISGDKNTSLIKTLAGITTSEKGNLRISGLNPSYYRPFLLKFSTKVPQNVVSLLQQAGRGYVTGTWKGTRFYGFPKDISVKPVFNESQEWTLLCSSLTNPAIFENINSEAIIIEDMGIISHKLPIKFVRNDQAYQSQHHFKQMDMDWHRNRIGDYSMQQPYFQKWQTNDFFDIQFITKGLSVDVYVIDKKGSVKDTITMDVIATSALITPYTCYQGTVDCSVLTAGETYWVKAVFGAGPGEKIFISEPFVIATDWPNTLLIEYSNDVNQPDLIWQAPYIGRIRVEGTIQKFIPGARVTQYEDQLMDVVVLDGQPSRGYELLLGGDYGMPDWISDKINRILMLSSLSIDGFAYSVEKDSKLEALETPGSPYVFWTIGIKEASNKAGIAIDATGEDAAVLTVEYNINTKGFSSNQSPANQQDQIIQITEIE